MIPITRLNINLRAAGPAAVLIAWVLGIVALGLFGKGENSQIALMLLAGLGGMVVLGLVAQSGRGDR